MWVMALGLQLAAVLPGHVSGTPLGQAWLGWGLMIPSMLLALAAYKLRAFCAEIGAAS